MAGLTTRRSFTDNASTAALSAGVNASAVSFPLSNFTGFPNPVPNPYMAIVDRGTASQELVLVTAGVASPVTVVRGYDGTTAVAHGVGATFEMAVGAKDLDEANAHSSDPVAHGRASALVGISDAQTVTGKTFSSNTHQATAVDPAVSAKANAAGTANLLQALDSAGVAILFQVARGGNTKVSPNDVNVVPLTLHRVAATVVKLLRAETEGSVEVFGVDKNGKLLVLPDVDGATALLQLKHATASPSCNSLEVRNSAGTVVARVGAAGDFVATGVQLNANGVFDKLNSVDNGFRVDQNNNVVAANMGGRVAVTQAASGSQPTVSGAERLWAALQTAAAMVSGRRYRITVTVDVSSSNLAQDYKVRVRNSKSASAPTTSSAVIMVKREVTAAGQFHSKTWVFTWLCDTTGTNTLGVSVERIAGATTEVSLSAGLADAASVAEVVVEDIGVG